MTDAERHQRAKEIFLELMAIPSELRASALAEKCGADETVRADVESLLAHAGDEEPSPQVKLGPALRFVSGDLFADRYRIVAELGRGASGVVYRAEDTRLGVEIALKILHRSSKAAIRHLVDEVRLARQISNPAICRIYDVEEAGGEYFLTMELVGGEDLASLLARVGRLSSEKVRTIGLELCRGLAAAHSKGILHRDLKPSNVMLDETGAVRLTDFGVAALASAADTAPLAGTPAYMAPEQIRDGAPASVRTDLYAAGLLLYEALAGSAPQNRADAKEAELPPRPSTVVGDVDPGLEGIVMALLAPQPEDRPASAAEVADRLAALDATRAPSSAQQPVTTRKKPIGRVLAVAAVAAMVTIAYVSRDRLRIVLLGEPTIAEEVAETAGVLPDPSEIGVAVLPILDESDAHDQQHLAEGVQDRIIGRLATIRGLRVIAEESADRFGDTRDVQTVARELGIDFVAVGTIRGVGDKARVELALHDGHTGERIWTESQVYGSVPSRALAVDREIAEELVTRLQFESVPTTVAPRRPAAEPDTQTYTLYLRGRERIPPFSRREFDTSIDFLKQVIDRAPAFAPAYSAIATAYVAACALRWVEPREGYPTARRYAKRAIALDETLAEAHVALALIAGEYDWDWKAAEDSYQRALALSPGAAWTHRSFARFLATQGRFAESLEETRRALELDPNSAMMAQGAAERFYDARQYERAAAMAKLSVRLDPIYPYSYPTLGLVLLEQAEYDEAIAQFEKALVIGDADAGGQARLAYAFARAGDRASMKASVAEARRLGRLDSMEKTVLAIASDDAPGAVAALAEAVEARAPPSIWLAVHPVLDPLRDREDFRALVAKVGLPTVAVETDDRPSADK